MWNREDVAHEAAAYTGGDESHRTLDKTSKVFATSAIEDRYTTTMPSMQAVHVASLPMLPASEVWFGRLVVSVVVV